VAQLDVPGGQTCWSSGLLTVAVAPEARRLRMTRPTVRIKIVSGSGSTVLEPLGDPDLDDGLPGNP
jgi:hypothetical protein